VFLPPQVHFPRDVSEKHLLSVQPKHVRFNVAYYPSSLRCPKLRRRFLDLFYFLGCLPQGIVSGFCWCRTLQECLDVIIFVVIEELF
jgi:hypothetical protein